VLKFSLNGGSLPTVNFCSSCPPYNSSERTTVENPFSSSTSIVARELLPREPVWLRSLPRNGSACYIAPFLRLFVRNSPQAYRHFFFSSLCGQNFRGWLARLYLWLLSCEQALLAFGRWPAPPQCFDTRFSNPDRRPHCSLHDLPSDGFPEDPGRCPLLPQT
jgi:hypothetical protein